METFLIYIGKSALAAGAFYIAFLLLFQNRKQFVFNRIYLPVSLALSFIIPLITFTTVRYIEPSVPVAESFSFLSAAPVEMAYEPPAFTLEWYHYLFGAYIVGSAGFLLYLLLGHFKALHIIKKSRIQELFQNLVNITNKDVHPFSFFNKIVLSEKTLAHPNLEMIVAHEKIHVKEKHTLDILFTEILFLLQWFNPFAWLIKDAVKNNLEYKTDDQIAKTNDAQTYQLAMVALADKKGVAPFLTAMNGSQLKNRIIMMKKKTQNKYALLKQLIVLPLLTVLVMGLANKEVKTEFLPEKAIIHVVKSQNLIHGKVTETITGRPIPNASIMLEGIDIEATTDKNGNYQIEFGENEKPIVVDVSAKGYYTNKVVYYGTNEKIDVHLEQIEGSEDLEHTRENEYSFSKMKVVVDGKDIPSDNEQLKSIDLTKGFDSQRIIDALNINNIVAIASILEDENPILYIRTSEYVPGTNKEFEKNTIQNIVLDANRLTEEYYYAIDNKIVSKDEFEEKGKVGFENVVFLTGEDVINKYGEKYKGLVADATSGISNFIIKDEVDETGENSITGNTTNEKESIQNDFSKLKIVVDGKEIPTDSPELKNVKYTKENSYNSRISIDIIEALNIDLNDVKGSSYSENPNNPYVYIRTKNYVPGTNKEFDEKTAIPENVKNRSVHDRFEAIFDENFDSKTTKTPDGNTFGSRKYFSTRRPETEDESQSARNSKKMADVLNEIHIRNLKNTDEHPLFVVDGKEVKDIEHVKPENIFQIEVIKGENALEKYGKKAKDGVVIITTKSGSSSDKPVILKSDSSEPVYAKVEDMPHFPGGELALRRYIVNVIRYPVIAQETGIEGKVYVSFIIDKNGNVTNARISKSREESLDEEALRVINSLPKWKPGKQDGKVVNVSYTVPISFALQKSSVEKRPLIVINGEVSGYRSMEEIDPGTLSSVNVLKGNEAITKYGNAAKDGAIEIALKGWTGKYKISSQVELRKFIAEKIKYPLEAQQAGYFGRFRIAVTFSTSGKVSDISQDSSKADLELGMVTITSYEPENKKQAPEINSDIMLNEMKRVINEFPMIDIDEFKGKTVLITVKFVLQ